LKYDVIALFNDVVANPSAYGLTLGLDLTHACLGSGTPVPEPDTSSLLVIGLLVLALLRTRSR